MNLNKKNTTTSTVMPSPYPHMVTREIFKVKTDPEICCAFDAGNEMAFIDIYRLPAVYRYCFGQPNQQRSGNGP